MELSLKLTVGVEIASAMLGSVRAASLDCWAASNDPAAITAIDVAGTRVLRTS